jgi:hypothetical protein
LGTEDKVNGWRIVGALEELKKGSSNFTRSQQEAKTEKNRSITFKPTFLKNKTIHCPI